MSKVEAVLARLDRVKPAGTGKWKARCPAHTDRTPSLSIGEGEGGAVLLHCFAGCAVTDVVAAVGLEMADLMPENRAGAKGNGRDQFSRPPRPAPAPAERAEAPRLFTLTRADQIERKATDWLIRGYLVRDTLAGLIAPPGACKSFLAVDWACRVATGTPWYGREVKQGAVFYLAGEGQRGLRKRMDGWERHNGVSLQGAPLYVASNLPFLCDPDNATATREILAATAEDLFFESGVEPALIVIDTVARAMNGANENAAEDMGRFIRAKDMLRHEWHATVLSVHHTGHDPNAQGRGRGSSNYGANLDSDFYLSLKGECVTLTAGPKAKDWRPPPPATLTRIEVEVESIGDDGQPERESTLVLHDAPGAVMEASKRQEVTSLHREGKSQREIVAATGIPKSTIQRWLKDAA